MQGSTGCERATSETGAERESVHRPATDAVPEDLENLIESMENGQKNENMA